MEILKAAAPSLGTPGSWIWSHLGAVLFPVAGGTEVLGHMFHQDKNESLLPEFPNCPSKSKLEILQLTLDGCFLFESLSEMLF